ncbi:MAG: HAD-IC family P-type ATPase [Candidatus Nanopelagicales bacterium]|nr:HAD-IC family P-type ATPase [Candidatus Nanopelagicales bacterium]
MPMPAGGTLSGDHHALAHYEVLLLLETDRSRGLTESEARRRLGSYGPNALPETAIAGRIERFLRQLLTPLVYVLLAAGAITTVLGKIADSAVIFGVVIVNAIVGYWQESKAQAELEALRKMVTTTARVRRDAHTTTVSSESLVPGDLVLIEAGDKVPADMRLMELAELRVDESALTGESQPVTKDEVALPADTPVADRRNMVYSGTFVSGGSGVGVVVATGSETELGEIHRLVGAVDPLATPLTRRLTWFSKVLTVVIVSLAVFAFAVGVARGESWSEMFVAAVALAVGAIPEGLPAAVTITLAIGVGRMARRRAVVRRLPAVETLGSTTVVCTDKTGTLTENQMTVRAIWTLAGSYEVTGGGYDPSGVLVASQARHANQDEALSWSLLVGALCNDASLDRADTGAWRITGDPTEAALLVVGVKSGMDLDDLRARHPRLDSIPFSSERQYMATLNEGENPGSRVILAKGAVERILSLCTAGMAPSGQIEPLDADRILRHAAVMGGSGLRFLATAVLGVDESVASIPEGTGGSLIFTGLHAMLDPPRQAAISAVRSCRQAGIAVKMITGDHSATAEAIALQVGIIDEVREGDVLTGEALSRLGQDELGQAAERASVFARVSPEQKLRLVEALQARRHVVAMTGDGVNDAPALRQADIGVAMGLAGTEAAKEAADMVLADDDFATIEAAVEEGRGVFDNLIKFIVWTLPTNMGEGFVILVAVALGTALPILPLQILWINMTTAVLLGLMLAFEPKESGIMNRPPRDPSKPLLTRALIERILVVSALLVGGSWLIFEWELSAGSGLEVSRTAAMNLFVTVEAFYLFSCRSLTRSTWRLGIFSNHWVIGGLAVQAVAQIAITYVPVMNGVFGTAPIPGVSWVRIVCFAIAASLVVAVDKRRHGAAM